MTYLLDTHTLLWAIVEPEKLSEKVRSLLENTDIQLVVSAISFWEISLKSSLGKLILENIYPEHLPAICNKMDIEVLPLDAAIFASYHQLAATYHKDPFDRMLVWLALKEHFTIISKNSNIKLYESEGLKVIW